MVGYPESNWDEANIADLSKEFPVLVGLSIIRLEAHILKDLHRRVSGFFEEQLIDLFFAKIGVLLCQSVIELDDYYGLLDSQAECQHGLFFE